MIFTGKQLKNCWLKYVLKTLLLHDKHHYCFTDIQVDYGLAPAGNEKKNS
jgi:hypothetical protein